MKKQLAKAPRQRIREIRLGFDMTQREFAVPGFFSKYLIENKEVIEEDIKNQARGQ